MRSNRNNIRGFTLIEVLIVLVIISIVAGGVMLSISYTSAWQQKLFVEEVAEKFSFLQEYAILQPALLQVTVEPHRIQFKKWQVDARTQNGEWVLLQEPYLQPVMIPRGYMVRVDLPHPVEEDKDTKEITSSILIAMNGDWTPFTLWIGRVAALPTYQIRGLLGGALQVSRVEDE